MKYAGDICDELISEGYIRPGEKLMILKMLRAMADICYETIFTGIKIKFPCDVGYLTIHKEYPKDFRRLRHHRKHVMKGHEYDINQRCHNPRTGGLIYSIRLIGGVLEKRKIKIKIAMKFRIKLFEELYYGELANTL